MKLIRVKDLMVPVQDYVTISQQAFLYQAVLTLEKAQEQYLNQSSRAHSYPHRALLVLDDDGRVIGKLSQLDIFKALEPKYQQITEADSMSKLAASGFSHEFLRNMLEKFGLFDKPLKDICKKAASTVVQDIMYTPAQHEYVREDDTLEVAVHQFIIGHHQSLLVTRQDDITGILRLVDVFREICQIIKACSI